MNRVKKFIINFLSTGRYRPLLVWKFIRKQPRKLEVILWNTTIDGSQLFSPLTCPMHAQRNSRVKRSPLQYEQECIPVGCVSSATVAVCFRGGLHTPPPGADPCCKACWDTTWKACWDSTPPCCKACWDTTCKACWDTPPGQNDRHVQKHNLRNFVEDGNYHNKLFWCRCR